ncbi:hypothetical protein D3C72_1350510 [compost metagenome]
MISLLEWTIALAGKHLEEKVAFGHLEKGKKSWIMISVGYPLAHLSKWFNRYHSQLWEQALPFLVMARMAVERRLLKM